jgi:hypothetical protein
MLQNQAHAFHQHGIAKTYVAEGTMGDAAGFLLGFATLIASELDIRGGYMVDDPAHANRYASLPAVKLARLAVDHRFRGCRIGETLVDFSLAVVVAQWNGISVRNPHSPSVPFGFFNPRYPHFRGSLKAFCSSSF